MNDEANHEPIGLLAGAGRFPIAFARKARELGRPVVCVGLRGHASPELRPLVKRFFWSGIAHLGRIIKCFRAEDVHTYVMAGKVQKGHFIGSRWGVWGHLPDWRGIRLWYGRRRDNRDDALLLSAIAEFSRAGLRCVSALDSCPELLVKPGLLTQREPTRAEWRDIEFGWELAKEMGRLDVGQTVAVKDRAVLAVEAIEGTDAAIARAGQLCPRGGFAVVKVAKPNQDMRFDVPTVGVSTVEAMRRAGGSVLAIERDRTILLDAEETVARANQLGISIVAR